MPKSEHQQATEIIARVLDLDREQALNVIEKECGENESLKKAVLALYNSIADEDLFVDTTDSSKEETKTSIQQRKEAKKSSSLILQGRFKAFFENKRVRFLILSLFLILLLTIGIGVRMQVRRMLLQETTMNLKEQLFTQKLRLERWIQRGTETIEAMAADPVVVEIARECDSLHRFDPQLALLANKDQMRQFQDEFRMSNSFARVPTGIVSREGAQILAALYYRRKVDTIVGIRLGKGLYDEYLHALDSTVYIKPVNAAESIFKVHDTTNANVTSVFFSPIRDTADMLIGVLYNTYLAREEFSEILSRVHFGQRGESYAFDINGRMLSSSRFTDDLKKYPYFGLAPDDESIYNIILKDPGGNILKGYVPRKSQVQMPLIKPLRDLEMMLAEQVDTGSYILGRSNRPYRSYSGKEVVSRWIWLKDYNFGILTEISLSEALSTLVYFDYAFLILYLLILTLSWFLYKSNVKIFRFGKRIEDFKQLGQYKLLEKLGEGGFGEVYKAEHSFLKTPVAIKLLKKQFNGTDMLLRFEKEVKVTSSLSNPNTIKVFDYGTTDDEQFYYVMEYLDGLSLDKLVNIERQLSVNRTIHVLLGVCYSLSEAHNHGLIHRDIKPMNVMVCNQGGASDLVKVLDFGLVKHIDTDLMNQTQVNRIGGTPMFMAPERLRDPFNTDQRVDIYSIGALGIYMFSGKSLLELVSQKMLSGEQTIQADFKTGLIESDEVPDSLRSLLMQCLSFDVNKRPQDISEVILVLEELRNEFPWSRKDAADWWQKFDVYGS